MTFVATSLWVSWSDGDADCTTTRKELGNPAPVGPYIVVIVVIVVVSRQSIYRLFLPNVVLGLVCYPLFSLW